MWPIKKFWTFQRSDFEQSDFQMLKLWSLSLKTGCCLNFKWFLTKWWPFVWISDPHCTFARSLEITEVQWGSKIRTSMDFDGQKEVGLQMIWFWMRFEIKTNGHYLVKSHLKSGQKHQDFEWSGFQMVRAKAIAIC